MYQQFCKNCTVEKTKKVKNYYKKKGIIQDGSRFGLSPIKETS